MDKPKSVYLANHHHTLAQDARSRGDLDLAASHDWYCAVWSAKVCRTRKPRGKVKRWRKRR